MNRQQDEAARAFAKFFGILFVLMLGIGILRLGDGTEYEAVANAIGGLLAIGLLAAMAGGFAPLLLWPVRIFEGMCVGLGVGGFVYLLLYDLGVHSELGTTPSAQNGVALMLSMLVAIGYLGARLFGWIELPTPGEDDDEADAEPGREVL